MEKDEKVSYAKIFWKSFQTSVVVTAVVFLVYSVAKSYHDVKTRNESFKQLICDCSNVQLCIEKQGARYCVDRPSAHR